MHKNKIVIIGAGKIGSVLKKNLSKNKANLINSWDVVAGMVKNQQSLDKIIPNADVVIMCVQAKHITSSIKQIKPFLNSKTIVATVTKGIEPGTHQFIDQVLKKHLKLNQPIALISGPMLASELIDNHGGAATIGTASAYAYKKIAQVFKDTIIVISHSKDMHGVAICGVMKNVYSFGLGIVKGLGWGLNMKGWFSAHALLEVSQLITALGGKSDTIYSQAGIGDFIATSSSNESKNIIAGNALARRAKDPVVMSQSEGYCALPLLAKVLGGRAKKYPILNTLIKCTAGKVQPRIALEALKKQLA